jgi:hypothetical protein
VARWCTRCNDHRPVGDFFPSYCRRGIARCRRCHARRSVASRKKKKKSNRVVRTLADRQQRKAASAFASSVLLHLRRQAASRHRVASSSSGNGGATDASMPFAPPHVAITSSQVREIMHQWQSRSIFSWLGLSPAALRRPSRAKSPESDEDNLALVVWRWSPATSSSSDTTDLSHSIHVTPGDVVPVTKREARIWRRRPHLFENSSWVMQARLQRDLSMRSINERLKADQQEEEAPTM